MTWSVAVEPPVAVEVEKRLSRYFRSVTERSYCSKVQSSKIRTRKRQPDELVSDIQTVKNPAEARRNIDVAQSCRHLSEVSGILSSFRRIQQPTFLYISHVTSIIQRVFTQILCIVLS
jgi:hypothetical protein